MFLLWVKWPLLNLPPCPSKTFPWQFMLLSPERASFQCASNFHFLCFFLYYFFHQIPLWHHIFLVKHFTNIIQKMEPQACVQEMTLNCHKIIAYFLQVDDGPKHIYWGGEWELTDHIGTYQSSIRYMRGH